MAAIFSFTFCPVGDRKISFHIHMYMEHTGNFTLPLTNFVLYSDVLHTKLVMHVLQQYYLDVPNLVPRACHPPVQVGENRYPAMRFSI